MPLFPAPLPQDSLPSPPIVVTVPRDSIQNADFLQSPSALFVFVMYDGDSCRLQRVLVMSSLMVPHQFSSRQRTPAVHVRVRCLPHWRAAQHRQQTRYFSCDRPSVESLLTQRSHLPSALPQNCTRCKYVLSDASMCCLTLMSLCFKQRLCLRRLHRSSGSLVASAANVQGL